jgi:hypothetical protein
LPWPALTTTTAATASSSRSARLRSHGVISSKPLHTLRKEFGSQIHARYGLLAASEALRHGGVSVTARHYIENKQRSVLGFGHLLVDNERVVIPMDNASAAYGAA